MTNNKKPWGILVPTKIQKILYPIEKIEYESGYILATILRRISVVLTYYILYPLRVNPNAVSLFSILLVFLASYLFINSYFFYGAILIIMWVLLDAIDGELARIQKKISKIGGTLEKINSDILYILFLPSLSIGLYKIEIIPFDYVWTSIISIAIYNTLRVYISTFPKVKKKFIKNEFILFIACQFKNSFKLRKKKPLYSFIFYVWRNIFTQCGLLELTLLIITFPIFNIIYLLNYFILFLVIGYFSLCLFIMMGILAYLKIAD